MPWEFRLSVTLVDHVQTAGWIEMPFGVGTCGDPRHIVLDKGSDPPRGGGLGWGCMAHCKQCANYCNDQLATDRSAIPALVPVGLCPLSGPPLRL